VNGPRPPLSVCIGALLVAGSPCSDGQTSPVPAPTDSSTKIQINSPNVGGNRRRPFRQDNAQLVRRSSTFVMCFTFLFS